MNDPKAGDPAVAWLQGFFHAFEWFNDKTNHICTFTLDIVPKPRSVREAIEHHFRGDLDKITLVPVGDWPRVARELLARWLFQFGDASIDHLEGPRGSFSLSDDYCRGKLLDEVLGKLSALVSPSAVRKVEVQTRGWYECHYEDLAFEETDRVIYLHLGVSD